MRVFNYIIIFIVFSCCFVLNDIVVFAQQPTLLTATITKVPQSFYGTWRVVSRRVDTDNPAFFREKSVDLWNLSMSYNVIELCNPFNGAKAEITIDRVESNKVVFSKTGKYDNKILSDTVEIMLEGGSFSGYDTLKLDTYSNGKLIKSDMARYSLKGEKIAGESILE